MSTLSAIHGSMSSCQHHWPAVRLGDHLDFVTSGSRGWAQYYSEAGSIFIRVGNFNRGFVSLDLSQTQRVQPLESAERHRTRIIPGDVLITITADLGMTAVVPGSLGEAYINQHVALLRPKATFNPYFLAWFIGCTRQAEDQLFEKDRGAVKAGLGLDDLRGLQVPLPPIETQQAIVAQLEARLSRLDKAVEDLRSVEAKLVRHRASVLAAATSGSLVPTEADLARREGRTYEPASVLLDRILAERRTRWEADQIASFRAKGKVPRDDKWKAKYDPPVAPNTTDLPELPEGWAWASGALLFSWSSGEGLTQKQIQAGEHPVYGGNGVTGYHNACVTMEPTLVIGRVGAQCGNVYLTSGPAWITDNAIYASSIPSLISMAFVGLVFTQAGLNQRSAGSGQPFVNQKMLNETAVALPPLAEQTRIVSEFDRIMSCADALVTSITKFRQRSGSLRSAILQAAFQPPEAAHAS